MTAMPARPANLEALAGRTILQIIPDLDAGGAERTTIDIAAALAEAGARPLVACRGGRLISELQAKGGVWIEFPAAAKNPLRMALNVRRLRDVIRSEAVDLVHARSRAPAWVALGAARWAGIPFVTTWHGAYNGGSAPKLLYNSVMARADLVIANSHWTAEQIGLLHPWARERLRVIPRGADMKQLTPDHVDVARVRALREAWGVTPDQPIVLLAARLTGWKGQKVLIDAAKILVERGLEETRFILAGDEQGRSSYRAELEARIANAGLGCIVRIVGHCADMPAALLASAVVAVPSTEPEAFGRVAVEAQAMGVPAVVTALGAAPETVLAPPRVEARLRTGWHVPPGDAQALADAIEAALGLGASAREALAIRARAHVEQQFSLHQMCAATLDTYMALLEGAAGKPDLRASP